MDAAAGGSATAGAGATATARGGGGGNGETEVREDDVVLPVAGIVDVLDNYAFVRTTGYLAGTDRRVRVAVDGPQVRPAPRRRRHRRRPPAPGRRAANQRQKFNPLVRSTPSTGRTREVARNRPEFTKLTPLYPNERLRLETEPHKLTTRVIDLVMPIGKGSAR